MTCEILQKHPEGLKIYNDFKKAASFYIETEFNDIIPTYNEFISNKKIKPDTIELSKSFGGPNEIRKGSLKYELILF